MLLVCFAGLPGTGKSTLAEAVGQALQTPVFALDWLLGASALAEVRFSSREQAARLGDELLLSLMRRQLRLGQSAIVESVTVPSLEMRWRTLCAEYGATGYGIETVCSDVLLHRRRVEGRQRAIPGRHEVPWGHVEHLYTTYQPWSGAQLTIDAVNPLADNIQTILAALREC